MRRSDSGANAHAVEVEPDEPEERCKVIQHVRAMSVCNKSDTPSVESGNLLSMMMDSGAEEHVVSLADWRRLGEPLLKPAQVRLRSATGGGMGVSGIFVVHGWCEDKMVELTALVANCATRSLCLRHRGSGSILLRRSGMHDFLSIRVMYTREINAIAFSTMKREVQSLKSELRARHAGHLSTSEARLPWTP